MRWSFFMNMRLRNILHTSDWFEIASKHVWFSTSFSFGFSIHPPDQNEAFWLGDNIMNIRSLTKRVLHFALICFRLFTRLFVIFDCFCIASCSPEAFHKSCLSANFPFHISHSLAFAFVPTRFLDSHRSHVAKQRQLNR